MIIDLQGIVRTKIYYFGKHLLGYNNINTLQKEKIKKGKLIFILDPRSVFKAVWNICIIFLLAWTGLISPYRISFFTDDEMNQLDIFHYMDSLIDIFFAVDIMVNFITAYEDRDGITHYQIRKIAVNYITGFFLIDFISSFPFNLFIVSEADNTIGGQVKPNNFLKLMRLQRMYRLMRIIRILKVFNTSNYTMMIQKFKMKMNIPPVMIKIVRLLAGAFFSVHLVACAYHLCAKFNNYS